MNCDINEILDILERRARRKSKISILELQDLFDGGTSKEEFRTIVLDFEKNGVVRGIKQSKFSEKYQEIYNFYYINKSFFKERVVKEIQILKFKIDRYIDLEGYYNLELKYLHSDMQYILKISDWIKLNGYPNTEVSAPERSYQLVGDEKWFDENGGKIILQRMGILEKMKITYRCDPLMIAINPNIYKFDHKKHLIVENKATFYDCFEFLESSSLASIVFGAGWKIASNISMLDRQLGLNQNEKTIYYFGDLDREGVAIWDSIRETKGLVLAKTFYRELLSKKAYKGKINHKKNIEKLERFASVFSEGEGRRIIDLLMDDYYYPQEALSQKEIGKIMEDL